MTVKAYVHLLSQPSRALLLFLKMTKIPHTVKIVDLMTGEHKTSEYVQNVHPLSKVPAIEDDGFKMIESIAILRYLARKYDVDDHWYPKDLKLQARVDEFLEWQHTTARLCFAMYFRTVFLGPVITGKSIDERNAKYWKKGMVIALDDIENFWLKRSPYLGGDAVSVADIIGLCEIDQLTMCKIDPAEGRPRLGEWLEKVRSRLQPYYNEVNVIVNKIIQTSKL